MALHGRLRDMEKKCKAREEELLRMEHSCRVSQDELSSVKASLRNMQKKYKAKESELDAKSGAKANIQSDAVPENKPEQPASCDTRNRQPTVSNIEAAQLQSSAMPSAAKMPGDTPGGSEDSAGGKGAIHGRYSDAVKTSCLDNRYSPLDYEWEMAHRKRNNHTRIDILVIGILHV